MVSWRFIRSDALDKLLMKTMPEEIINTLPKRELTWTPDENMGEGQATTEELSYRQDLLDLGNRLFKAVGKIMDADYTYSVQIQKIDIAINDFIQEGQKLVLKQIPKTWNDSVEKGMNTLQRIKRSNKYDEDQIQTQSKDLIISQQQMNIEDIALRVRGRLRQQILIDEIHTTPPTPSHINNTITNAIPRPNWTQCMIDLNKTSPNLTEEELRDECSREWETGFSDVEQNLDKMGLAGWLWANKLALISTLAMGTAVIGDLIADWVSQQDDRVCEDCLELEAGSPYSVLSWPDEPHFGCRCEMQNIRLESI